MPLTELKTGKAIEIVWRPDGAKGFVVIATRWVVERTLACFGRCCRLAKDLETNIASISRPARRVVRHIQNAEEF